MSSLIDECILEAMDEIDVAHGDEDGELIDQIAGDGEITIDTEVVEMEEDDELLDDMMKN